MKEAHLQKGSCPGLGYWKFITKTIRRYIKFINTLINPMVPNLGSGPPLFAAAAMKMSPLFSLDMYFCFLCSTGITVL